MQFKIGDIVENSHYGRGKVIKEPYVWKKVEFTYVRWVKRVKTGRGKRSSLAVRSDILTKVANPLEIIRVRVTLNANKNQHQNSPNQTA